MTDPLLDDLCAFAANLSYDDLPADAVETTTLRVFDSLAVGLLALREEPVERLVDYASTKRGAADAPILGTELTASPEYAAFANASMIRYLDWNDTYLAAEAAHPSCNLGAILATGAANDSTGRELLTATVLAYEVQCRLCDLAAFTEVGFDHVNWGLVSVPLAVGRLMGLSEDELRQAVSIALTGHLGLLQARQAPISEWKGFAFGNAARNGVVAAELAAGGVHGPAEPFVGVHGVGSVVDGDLDAADLALGDGFLIEETHLKRYPICHHALAGVDCVVEMVEDGLDPRDVRSIDVDTYDIAIRVTADEGKWRPTTRATADHSLPYCLARVLLDGTIGPDDLEEDRLAEDDVLALMDAVSVNHEPAFTERYGDAFSHEVTITTESGAVHERRVDYPLGHVENPLSAGDVAGKVLDHTDCRPEAVDDLRAAVEGLDKAAHAGALLDAARAVGDQL